jgi:predicted O-methyltransferase YrrM
MQRNQAGVQGQDAVAAARAALEAAIEDAPGVDLSWLLQGSSRVPWALAPDALRFLVSLVARLRPQHILEFGSGLSTRALACAAAGLRPACSITSVDHDPGFLRTAEERLREQEEPRCQVKSQLAPLVLRDCGEKRLPVYHLQPEGFASRRPPDLVLVDGPPKELGGREGVLYQALDYARPGTVVLLDDAHRPAEQAILRQWRDKLGGAIEASLLPGFSKGLAAIIVRMPVPRTELEAHSQRLTVEDLEAVILPEDTSILVDEGQWPAARLIHGSRWIPFLERDGQYWGKPEDDATAIRELERLRLFGARFMVFVWPALWWLEYYSGLNDYLRAQFRCIRENSRLVVFDLRP